MTKWSFLHLHLAAGPKRKPGVIKCFLCSLRKFNRYINYCGRNVMRSLLLVAATLIGTLALADSAEAQVRTGIAHPTYGSTHGITVHEHARDHVRLLYHYARTRPEVPREVVVRHTKAVRSNIQAAKRVNEALAKTKADDETVQKTVASIAGCGKEAIKHLKVIDKAAQEETVDSEVIAQHSKQLHGVIQAALKDHEALHKHLGGGELTEIEG
jgi:hypothetical protein